MDHSTGKRSRQRIEKLLLEAEESGPATEMTKADWDQIRNEIDEVEKAAFRKRVEALLLEAEEEGPSTEMPADEFQQIWREIEAELRCKSDR